MILQQFLSSALFTFEEVKEKAKCPAKFIKEKIIQENLI
jgi:hypothetical protein